MATLQVTLSERQQAFVEAQLAAAKHASAEEFVLALVDDAQRREAWSKVERSVLAGLDTPLQEMSADDWRKLQEQIQTAEHSRT